MPFSDLDILESFIDSTQEIAKPRRGEQSRWVDSADFRELRRLEENARQRRYWANLSAERKAELRKRINARGRKYYAVTPPEKKATKTKRRFASMSKEEQQKYFRACYLKSRLKRLARYQQQRESLRILYMTQRLEKSWSIIEASGYMDKWGIADRAIAREQYLKTWLDTKHNVLRLYGGATVGGSEITPGVWVFHHLCRLRDLSREQGRHDVFTVARRILRAVTNMPGFTHFTHYHGTDDPQTRTFFEGFSASNPRGLEVVTGHGYRVLTNTSTQPAFEHKGLVIRGNSGSIQCVTCPAGTNLFGVCDLATVIGAPTPDMFDTATKFFSEAGRNAFLVFSPVPLDLGSAQYVGPTTRWVGTNEAGKLWSRYLRERTPKINK